MRGALLPVFLAQALHGLTFTCLYNGGIHYVDTRFPAWMQGTAQSLYDGLSRLVEYFWGMLLMGWIFDATGLKGVFAAASGLGILSLTGLTILIFRKDWGT